MSSKKNKEKIRINRNSSPEISHTIKKIKANEKKYSTILVIIFMTIFIMIGYFSLSIHTDLNKNYKTAYLEDTNEVTISSRLVTLTNEKESIPYKIEIINNTNTDKKYKILLIEDEKQIEECGCMDKKINPTTIQYSINKGQKNIMKESDNTLTEVAVPKEKEKSININFWIEETPDKIDESHFHGYFKVEEA